MNEYDICYPDYNRSIVNIPATVSRYFGAQTEIAPIPELYEMLKTKNIKRIVFMVFDGLGSMNLDNAQNGKGFLIEHKLADISSVFPPTTVAAMNSLYSGQFPNRHCRIGWTMYFKKIDEIVTVFKSKVLGEELPYVPFYNLLPGITPYFVSPFSSKKDKRKTISGIFRRVKKLIGQKGHQFIFTYHFSPDNLMHKTGTKSRQTYKAIADIEKAAKKLYQNLQEDTAVIMTADHGQIDQKGFILLDERLEGLLERPPTVEPTACAFFVKEGQRELFKRLFDEKYAEIYRLYTKEEILASGLFGPGKNNERLSEFTGDFFAVAIGDKVIVSKEEMPKLIKFKGIHAGLHKGEMTVPLIVLTK